MDKSINIFYDQSGTLRSDLFYEFHGMFEDEPADSGRDRSWIVVPRMPTSLELARRDGKDAYCWVKSIADATNRIVEHACKSNPHHVTRSHYKTVQVEVNGGKRSAEFIPDSNEMIVVSTVFANRLRGLPIQGMELKRAEISDNEGEIKDPKFDLLQFVGRNCMRIRTVKGAPNECPFCRTGPVVCQECGEYWPVCPQCKKQSIVRLELREGVSDKRLVADFAPEDKTGHILEGKRWDGADLLQSWGWNFISKRVLDWLLMVHAAPFYVKPARFCIDGMSDKQLARLEEIQKPLE